MLWSLQHKEALCVVGGFLYDIWHPEVFFPKPFVCISEFFLNNTSCHVELLPLSLVILWTWAAVNCSLKIQIVFVANHMYLAPTGCARLAEAI